MELKNKRKNYFNRLKKKIKNVFHSEEKASFNTVEVIVVIIISILFGVIVGCILTYGKGLVVGTDDKYVEELVNTYDTILENSFNDVTEEELLNAAIDGMVGALGDEYSYYMNESETTDFNQQIDGSYIGIGATIIFSDTGNSIIDIFKDSPAEIAGLEVGDIIIGVDDKDVSNYSSSELSDLLIGTKGTDVKVKVKRGSEEKTYSLTRDVVVIPSVSSKIVSVDNKNIGYIDIDNFAANTYYQFKDHLTSLEKNDIDGLIIDVRDNLGGHLNQVNKILSLFFNKKTVLYQIETKSGVENIYSSSKETRNYDVVVLINSGSASASEILASSFKDNYKKATVVGVTSYGKGTIQSAIQLSTGSSLKYTSQKWLTSKGEWLNGVGVVPDEFVEIEDSYYSVASDSDSQYQKALEILSK